jgi:hypothetical protein
MADQTTLIRFRHHSRITTCYKASLNLLISSACLSWALTAANAQNDRPTSLDTKEVLRNRIISVWKARENKVSGFKIHLKLDSFSSAKMLQPGTANAINARPVGTSSHVIVSVGNEGQLRFDNTGTIPTTTSRKISKESRIVWNSGSLKLLNKMPNGAHFGKIGRRPLPFTQASYMPIYWSCAPFRYDINPIPITSNTAEISYYTYRATQCVRVFEPEKLRFWILDPAMDMSVVRYENQDSGGRLSHTMTIEYDRHLSGVFMPVSWNFVLYTPNRELLMDVKALVTKSELQQSFPENYFDIDFPPGTYMREDIDNNQERHYVKTKDPKDETTIRIMGDPPAVSPSIASTPYRLWLIMLNIVAIVALSLMTLNKRRKNSDAPDRRTACETQN